MEAMKTADFLFDLPEELIAAYPPAERGGGRLLVLDRRMGRPLHRMIADLPELLSGTELLSQESRNSGLVEKKSVPERSSEPDKNSGPPLLVFNNSRVRKARIKGVSLDSSISLSGASNKDTGSNNNVFGDVEFLLLNRIDSHIWRTMVNRTKRRRPKQRFRFAAGTENEIEGEIVEAPPNDKSGEFRYLRFDSPIDDDWLDIHGHIPLPPYIKRNDEASDAERYQTIYADRTAGTGLGPGASAAAPTAGLHFTEELLAQLDNAGIEKVFITLHVGLGTFLPVRSEHIEDHIMHEEAYSISEDAAQRINAAKAAGRKIIAVGTTSVRTLESAWTEGGIKAGENTTSIFIYPGYRFRVVDALFTNFHTPGSTLLMLAAAFAGQELILDTYAEAVREGYRFFSYGDAMLIYGE